jgi:hypothetical protein
VSRALWNVSLATLYAGVYMWCYIVYLYPNFGYAGFDYFPRPAIFLVAAFIISALPALCYRGTRAVSSVLSVLIYLVLYVPIIMTFALACTKPLDEIVAIQLTFLAGMTLIVLADLAVIENPIQLSFHRDLMPFVLGLTVCSIAYMLLVYRGNLKLPDFGADLYLARAENEDLGKGLVTRYLSSWLATVLAPVCMAHGLTRKKLIYTVVGAAGCIVLYVAAAAKISMVLPFVYIGFYFYARNRLTKIYPILVGTLSLVIVALVGISNFGTIIGLASSIVLMRTLGNGGQITVAYYDFFASHPQTDYSHVMGVKLLTHPYPYGNLSVAEVIGQYYFSPLMVANANFWATDGVAAMGLVGVLLTSLMCAAFFVALNSVTREYDLLFVVMCFLSFLNILLNQSLFSSIWSGGGFFILVFLLFNKKDKSVAPRRRVDPPEGMIPSRAY